MNEIHRLTGLRRSIPNQARLWEPHVVAGEWSLDLDWFVAAAKEMVRCYSMSRRSHRHFLLLIYCHHMLYVIKIRVAEETIEQVGVERTASNEKMHGQSTQVSEGSSSSSSDEDKPRDRQSSKKGHK